MFASSFRYAHFICVLFIVFYWAYVIRISLLILHGVFVMLFHDDIISTNQAGFHKAMLLKITKKTG